MTHSIPDELFDEPDAIHPLLEGAEVPIADVDITADIVTGAPTLIIRSCIPSVAFTTALHTAATTTLAMDVLIPLLKALAGYINGVSTPASGTVDTSPAIATIGVAFKIDDGGRTVGFWHIGTTDPAITAICAEFTPRLVKAIEAVWRTACVARGA